MPEKIVTAAMVAIGDELLSGRTRDSNIGHLAAMLTAAGIDLMEVRIVGDDPNAIAGAVNSLRARHTHVFTSGGIGPTHDDITADAIALAFGLPCRHDRQALAIMAEACAARGLEFTEARRRMARMPEGATHIDNPVSVAPGFSIGNVHAMAGVPSIFQAMLDRLLPRLEKGALIHARTVPCPFGEGAIGDALARVQTDHRDTAIGSYPRFDGQNHTVRIVVRSRDVQALERAVAAVEAMLAGLDVTDAAAV